MDPLDDNTSVNESVNSLVKDIFCSLSKELLGKRIVMCITGSVAAYRAIDLTRLLIRHGAHVRPVMSNASVGSGRLLTEEIMKWASGNHVVTKLTANLEHIFLADYNMSDLIVVYPCTANTIGKMASGIDDTPVTSVLSVALGSKLPIVVAPAMHRSMYANPIISKNIDTLKKLGVLFVDPYISEKKAKLAEPEELLRVISDVSNKNGKSAAAGIQKLNEYIHVNGGGAKSLSGRNILVTSGSTIEFIDPLRVVTNLSSGKMGAAIAEEAYKRGAQVTLVCGIGSHKPQKMQEINIINVGTGEEMYNAVMKELATNFYDAVFMAAAIADFKPLRKLPRKLETRNKDVYTLKLSPTRKIVDEIKGSSKNSRIFLVAFKADHNRSNAELINDAIKKMLECNCDLIVANDVGRKGSETGSETSEIITVDKEKKVTCFPLLDKKLVARKLLELAAARLQ
ncbi:MAG: bifunctional phosphopantothenoylcysteine decarboxylase/phosphopantothenate--cysteine ligase CoaBC [Thermoproteota archaeon]|nr:bifunctional phosphopantothenoylcysteine decarboxylase/phosphopantothenate--cysteine ligase CoaBC [Thermoproteota archaeon]